MGVGFKLKHHIFPLTSLAMHVMHTYCTVSTSLSTQEEIQKKKKIYFSISAINSQLAVLEYMKHVYELNSQWVA